VVRLGDTDTATDALKAAMKSGAGKGVDPTGKATTSASLPLVTYSRKPGFTNSSDPKTVQQASAWNEALTQAIKVSVLPLQTDYRLLLLAWDKTTIDKMGLAWYAYIAHNSFFETAFDVGGEILKVNARINDHKSVTLSDSSIPAAEGRIFALETALTVNVTVLFGEAVSVPESVTVQFDQINYG
jgi:hypothetical protein